MSARRSHHRDGAHVSCVRESSDANAMLTAHTCGLSMACMPAWRMGPPPPTPYAVMHVVRPTLVAEWQMVTVASRLLSSMAAGMPTMLDLPTTTARLPLMGMLHLHGGTRTRPGAKRHGKRGMPRAKRHGIRGMHRSACMHACCSAFGTRWVGRPIASPHTGRLHGGEQ